MDRGPVPLMILFAGWWNNLANFGHQMTEKSRFQYSLGKLLLWTSVVAALCSGFVCVRNWVVDVPRPVSDPSEFPWHLHDLTEAASAEQIEIEELKVAWVEDGLYEECFWTMEASPRLVDFATTHLELSPLQNRPREIQYFWKMIPKMWRVPPATGKTEYSISPGCVSQGYGVIMMNDVANERLYFQYMWHL